MNQRVQNNMALRMAPHLYDSRCAIGQQVMFQWYEHLRDVTDGMLCEVAGVSFREGKVLYDLAPYINGEFYHANPLRQVDSIFVYDLPASMAGPVAA